MIDLNFGLWWSGGKMSYLRYLTFKTLRHFHPHSRITLYVGTKFKNNGYKWNVEKQDFESDYVKEDYLPKIKELGITVIEVDWFSQYPSNFQSDFFRYWFINQGGFYLDCDQIILKSLENVPRDCDFIYSGYQAATCGYYTPVGVLGSSNDCGIVKWMMDILPSIIDVNNYNSAGPFALRHVLTSKMWDDKIFNAPYKMFYPVPESIYVASIYNGSFVMPEESVAIHWYGGAPLSQEFNKKYTEDFALTSNDTISKFLREKELI